MNGHDLIELRFYGTHGSILWNAIKTARESGGFYIPVKM